MQVNRYISDDYKQTNFVALGVVICTKEKNGEIYGMGFFGKRSKPDFSYRFKSIEQRNEYVDKYLNNIADIAQEKAARRASKKEFEHTLKVGDVLYSSWGYDQTNIDFYEVVEVVSSKTVKIREIKAAIVDGISDGISDGVSSMAAHKVAVRGEYIDEPILKRVAQHNSIAIDRHQHATPWSGNPLYCSWYA